MEWRWDNVPVPPQHVVGVIAGGLLQAAFGKKLFARRRVGIVLGLPLVALSLGLAVWSVREAGAVRVEAPDRLLTGGPYSMSRNPMYASWTLLHAGLGLALNSPWVFALAPVAGVYTHLVDVRGEERFLESRFGDEYLDYRGRVPRYV
jgi:protein-S-isoprenylcysteine O-methyltransferase Ste14